jgi:hypothetical protein
VQYRYIGNLYLCKEGKEKDAHYGIFILKRGVVSGILDLQNMKTILGKAFSFFSC